MAAGLRRTQPGQHGRLRAAPEATAVYCCGPEPLIDCVRGLMPVACPTGQLHVERFAAPTRPAHPTTNAPFEIELRRTGRVLHVPADRSALDVLREVVPDIRASCAEGVCGRITLDL